jgi:dienelactone hydrolase
VTVSLLASARRSMPLSGMPSPRRIFGTVGLLLVAAVASTTFATFAYLRVPASSGDLGVGRTDVLLIDPDRTEPAERGGGPRALRVVAWYPAEPGTGERTTYVPGHDQLESGLGASGEIPVPFVAGLRLVGTSARADAVVAGDRERYPVVVFSPGNATNVAFYAGLAEDLASRGFVVLGVDHPYQVAAVDVGDRVAVYREPMEIAPGEAIPGKIDERVADISFLLDRLSADGAGLGDLSGQLDLDRLGVAGHSNGGITAAVLCSDDRVDACLNIDGQLAGGPFSPLPDPVAPTKPFLYLTKETRLHPSLVALLEGAGDDAYRVMVPAASHDAFTDGPRLRPRLLPVDGIADQVLRVERGVVAAFFHRYLRDDGPTGRVFDGLDAPTDVYIEVYPLRGLPTLTPPD